MLQNSFLFRLSFASQARSLTIRREKCGLRSIKKKKKKNKRNKIKIGYRVSSFEEGTNGARFTMAIFDVANKVRGCLRQPIFNDCMASMCRAVGKQGGEGTGRERVAAGRQEAGKCRRDENRGAGFRAENEMELNDS